MTMIPIIFSTLPSLAMSAVVNLPVEKTIVLGAVATGSMKAQLALIAAGTIKRAGSISAPIAAAAKIGIISVVVAVLLVISVRNVIARQIMEISSKIGHPASPASASPRYALSPEAMNALAMAIPPPNRISIPQGIRAAVSQSSNLLPLPSGTRNMMTTAIRATLASLASGTLSHSDHPPNGSLLVIQASAVIENTMKTLRSSVCHCPTAGISIFPW